ncbi:hypothetical protein [uncultured Methanolobus sp.]|uniref:hypothetical protein n=1 Tax=uncultured Methanolobus sp. TaxID=218300 RepID=UPI0029C6259D|nr:hypothetical protein [uncultured Methanolobus sp.]
MGFTSGGKTLPDIIDEIAAALIASSANWSDGDTTWDTTETSNDTDTNRRCLKYTGDAADIWLALESINDDVHYYGASVNAKGLRITFSSSWDSVNHAYGTTNSQTFIGFQGDDSSPQADLNSMILTYYLWVDSSGFALMAKPEPFSVDDRQSSFITVVEHMGTKEYSDGLTNFYCFTQRNVGTSWTDSNDHDGFEQMPMIRPFAYETRTIGQGIQFWYHDYNNRYALKSTGNGKVYFVKPVICNSTDNFTPIYQSELFFKFSEDAGLVDGDVIAIDGETTKYICKTIDSPDSTARLNFAIKYVA